MVSLLLLLLVISLFVVAAWKANMNGVFFVMVAIAFCVAAVMEIFGLYSGDVTPMTAMTSAMLDSAAAAVTLAIGLIGMMTLFLGLVSVVEAGGGLTILAKLLRPVMIRLFPEVPADHPAMGAMIMNVCANALGLGNAATPFGIKAMQALDELNPHQGTATNSMALFLAINTSSVTILPSGIIALRASSGSLDAAGIFVPTLFATICSTTVAIIVTKFMQRFSASPPPTRTIEGGTSEVEVDAEHGAYPLWVSLVALGSLLAVIPIAIYNREAMTSFSTWVLPGLMFGMLAFGAVRRVAVYEVMVQGARDGIDVAFKIIPYLVAILVAVALFRASGSLDFVVNTIGPYTGAIGLPGDALPMAMLRPLSGSGAYGIVASTLADPAIGPDSYVGYLVSTLQGSTETTFYVIAVYFGAVRIKNIRHTMLAALTADAAGIAGAIIGCQLFL